jgi:hypothetical protein
MRRLALSFLVAAMLVARVAWAADDPFVGDWKLDVSRSHILDQMKVENLGSNKYSFDFGGSDETITVDGTDQPDFGGTTLAVTAKGPAAWNVTRKQGGKRVLSADWSLSKDGKSLTDRFTSFDADGTGREQDLVYARAAGGPGFAGTWQRDASVDSFVMQVRPYEAAGLAFTYLGKTKDMRFDGKDYAPVGSNALPGLVFSTRRVSAELLEVTDKFGGKLFDTQQITLSADHQTLRMTTHNPGKDLPNVFVFQRQ